MNPLQLYIGNDNLLTVSNVINQADGEPVTGATITVTIKDTDGTALGEALVLTERDPGFYQGTLAHTLDLPAGEHRAHISILSAIGEVAYFEKRVAARVRS